MARKSKGAAEDPQPKKRSPAATEKDAAWKAKRETERNRQADASRKGRDIGPMPPIAEPKRRAKAEKSFRAFLEAYFPHRFVLAWSKDHLTLIESIERTINDGGLEAFAMPRGTGKTTICECAVMWAVMTGRRKFVALIGASKSRADEMLDSVKSELETNELLSADWPEVCYPIQRLEGINNRCKGQHSWGKPTRIRWAGATIVLPTISGSRASAAIICVRGITGSIRGMKFTRPDGEIARPSLALIDDPQTDQSAHSPPQCAKRVKIISGAVLGLAGPGKKIAAFMPCTIITQGDMADEILDRTQHPDWHGRICKLMYAFPTNDKLWEEYATILADDLRADGNGAKATAFYKKHRKAMDVGAKPAWPERKNPDELSAIQHAMNLRLRNEAAFMAEYQNEPLSDVSEDTEILTALEIAKQVSGLPRRVVPVAASLLTAFVDVQKRLLYWAVGAFTDDFSGTILDYGTWPNQQRAYFSYRAAKVTLQSQYKTRDTDAAITAGMRDLCAHLLARKWTNEAGAELAIERALVDVGDGNVEQTLYTFVRTCGYPALMAAKGKGITATGKAMHEYQIDKAKGERHGYHWMLKRPRVGVGRLILVDTNFWKSFLHERLALPLGQVGGLTLFGQPKSDHRLFSEHLAAERRHRVKDEGSGRIVDQWTNQSKTDNHWFDCAVGCCVAASMQGATALPKPAAQKKPAASEPKKQRVTYLA